MFDRPSGPLQREEEFRREPMTTFQRRLIEIICLYSGHCFETVAQEGSSRWEAGCWIKEHLPEVGDWLYFDG